MANIRVACGYRTISGVAAGLIGGVAPLNIIAESHHRVYRWKKDLLKGQWHEDWPTEEISARESEKIYGLWENSIRIDVAEAVSALLTQAFQGRVRAWRERKYGAVSYWTTQLLTGHGSFGSYLNKINKQEDAMCRHCGEEEDTTEHTLERCPSWLRYRMTLHTEVGEEVSTRNIVAIMLSGRGGWNAINKYCEAVMKAKAQLERDREKDCMGNDRGRKRKRTKRENGNGNGMEMITGGSDAHERQRVTKKQKH